MNRNQPRQDFARSFVHAVTIRPFLRDLKRMHDAPSIFMPVPSHRSAPMNDKRAAA